jgi:hypothetical protein
MAPCACRTWDFLPPVPGGSGDA